MVPPGTTSKVQPLDVAVNSEFKNCVDQLATEHMAANLESFMSGKITASERRILFTKWVGTAWQDISRRLRETMIRSFEKCGIALPLDGSRDSEINIEGLDDYEVGEDCSGLILLLQCTNSNVGLFWVDSSVVVQKF